jgi:hypothetical protein
MNRKAKPRYRIFFSRSGLWAYLYLCPFKANDWNLERPDAMFWQGSLTLDKG